MNIFLSSLITERGIMDYLVVNGAKVGSFETRSPYMAKFFIVIT